MRATAAAMIAVFIVASCTSAVAPPPSATGPAAAGLTKLPLGDGKRSTSAQVGWMWSCALQTGGGGAQVQGPWIHGTTWDMTAKVAVSGSVSWPHQMQVTLDGATRVITSNGLPDHPSGVFPVETGDPAYQYDRNPNRIAAQSLSYRLPANPVAGTPQCAGGTVGISLEGGMIFNSFDAQSKDAVANEVQDKCGGHPERTGRYQFHGLPLCFADTTSGHSTLYGYSFDGFGIYGVRGVDGRTLANVDLDECHGHVHEITWDGVTKAMYHYHFTYAYPYTLGCYRGQPVRVGP